MLVLVLVLVLAMLECSYELFHAFVAFEQFTWDVYGYVSVKQNLMSLSAIVERGVASAFRVISNRVEESTG